MRSTRVDRRPFAALLEDAVAAIRRDAGRASDLPEEAAAAIIGGMAVVTHAAVSSDQPSSAWMLFAILPVAACCITDSAKQQACS